MFLGKEEINKGPSLVSSIQGRGKEACCYSVTQGTPSVAQCDLRGKKIFKTLTGANLEHSNFYSVVDKFDSVGNGPLS